MARPARRFLAAATAAAALAAAPGVRAQAPGLAATLAPSQALACLTPGWPERGAIEYPFQEWKSGVTGSVTVALGFSAPDAAPQVEVLAQEGGRAFVDAVREQVARWRVPCLPPGETVRLEQSFAFVEDRRVAYAKPTLDARDVVRQAAWRCRHHIEGIDSPRYPVLAQREGVQGRIIAEAVFDAPDRPPAVRLHHRANMRLLRGPVTDWLEGLRLPCLSGERVSVRIDFVYRFSDETFGLKPLTLLQLLGHVKDLRKTGLKLDTTTMGCPFDLRWAYSRPQLPNHAEALGDWRPQRQPLLDLLAGVELAVPEAMLDAVWGDRTVVTVPCVRIDIPPA